MHLRLESDRDEYQFGRTPAGRSVGNSPEVSVSLNREDGGTIELDLDPHPGEAIDDHIICRRLDAGEARELAAMLNHAADALDRHNGFR